MVVSAITVQTVCQIGILFGAIAIAIVSLLPVNLTKSEEKKHSFLKGFKSRVQRGTRWISFIGALLIALCTFTDWIAGKSLAEDTAKSHGAEIQSMQQKLDSISVMFEPIRQIALSYFPNLDLRMAVESLAVDIMMQGQELEGLKRYLYVAELNCLGKKGLGGNGIVETSPISRIIEPAYAFVNEGYYVRCTPDSEDRFRRVISEHPDFPFAYYGLALCLRKRNDDSWPEQAKIAVRIFEHTVRISGHHPSHDEALAELKRYLSEKTVH